MELSLIKAKTNFIPKIYTLNILIEKEKKIEMNETSYLKFRDACESTSPAINTHRS